MHSKTTTFDLVEKIREGDKDAFTTLFERYRRRLLVLIRYRMSRELQARMEAEDLLQETFLRAARDFSRFEYRGAGSFLHWLFQIALHVTTDAARFHSRQARNGVTLRFRSASNPGGPEPVDPVTPGRHLAETENLKALLDLMRQLPEHYRQVILLSKFEGLTTAEIAAHLGKSSTDAALLLHRAVKRLRQLMAEGHNR